MIMYGQTEEYREVVSVKMLQGPARYHLRGLHGCWRQNLLMTNIDVGTNVNT